jgi:hypothetical protein
MVRHLLTLSLILSGCVGEADWVLAPGGDQPTGPTGPTGPSVAFQGLSEGLPSSPSLAGTAQLDGTLYAVANDGLYALPSGSSKWTQVDVMQTGERATSITRIDTAIYMTTSDGAGHGGLYRRSLADDTFTAVAGAPNEESYALLKKDGELLMTTTGALLASSDSGATWKVRSTAALFASPVTQLVASPAALRMFVVVSGALYHSDDSGATWSDGIIQDQIVAISAAGQYVLVQTASGTVRSDNYGNTFHPVDIGGSAATFVISGQQAFAGTTTGLRASGDAGATWKDANNGLPAGTAVTQLFLSGGALVASTGAGVYVAQLQ